MLVRPVGGRAARRHAAAGVRDPAGRVRGRRGAAAGELRSFQGYRLLQEYFAFPQRYRFFELTGLAPSRRAACAGNELELVMLFGRGDPTLESVVDGSNFAAVLHAGDQPVREARIDRIHVTDSTYEFHVVADRTRPLDFEIYQVTDVVGHGAGDDSEQRFLPFYSASSTDAEHPQSAYFTTRREPRLVSPEQKRRGVAVELHRQRGVPVAGRSDAGALFRGPAAAVDAGAVHQSRPGAADADRARADRLLAGHRRAGDQRARDQRPEPAVRAAGRRRDRLARDQPPVAQLSVAGERHRPGGRGRAARSARALRDHRRRRAPGGRSRASGR